MDIKEASEFASLFWPKFAVHDGLVFLDFADWNTTRDASTFPDRTAIESFLNHIHVLDLFSHEASMDEEPYWNTCHPHFTIACDIGRSFAQSWAHKLSLEFPDRRFRVYFTRDDNPVVRFHQMHDGEPPWLEREQNDRVLDDDAVLIVDVCRGSETDRSGSRSHR